MKIYYNLFSMPIKIAPYFRGLQKFASLEQLETGLYKIHVKIRKNNFYTPCNEVRGGGILESQCPSVCLSVRLSVDARLGKIVSSA